MPLHPVTSTLMYRGICTIPDILTYKTPVNIPEDELEEIRQAFMVFDRDGNGFISKQELGMAMRSLGYMPNEVELEVIIQRLDMDGDGQVDFDEFVTLLGPKLSSAGMPDKFHGTDFDTVFWKCDMQKLTVEELKRLLYDTFCDHLSMKDIENIIMTEEEGRIENPDDCPVDIDTSPTQQIKQTCVRKSLIGAFAIAFIISVMLIAANQCDMQKLTVEELKRLLYDTFCDHLSMKDIENIIMTEEEGRIENPDDCPVDIDTSPTQQIKQTCVRKSLIGAFAIAFIISVMLIAANQVLRSGMK
ncbi:CABP7 protein, partial [Polyodon spathula]|nr:CABP7 protein [Polyodon spathula]